MKKRHGIFETLIVAVIYSPCLTFLSSPVLAQSPQTCPSGMVSYWTFDDQAHPGNDDFDSNPGTINGDPVWTDGRVGGALSLDGNGDYVNVSGFDDLDGLHAATFEFWI
ncbi:MAG: hypothetical protein ABII00_18300, partial [Elusimicrobiota bacterium]